MTTAEWLAYAKQHQTVLTSLVEHYHPLKRNPFANTHRITAPNAEAAAIRIRADIRRNSEGDPTVDFKEAMDSDNVQKINSLLNDTWFGVPESTDCWRIEGFREAVYLMEDLPNEEDGNDPQDVQG